VTAQPHCLWCPLCGEQSARIDGPAGDEAVTVKCGRCRLPYILPATAEVIERVRGIYAAVPEALPPVAADEGTMADGPG
jgi:hypothetical protein